MYMSRLRASGLTYRTQLYYAIGGMAAYLLLTIGAHAQIAPATSAQIAPAVPPADSSPAAPVVANQGEFQFSVIIIDELTPKPVPLTSFRITSLASPSDTQTLKTDIQGQIDAHLMAGSYSVESEKPTLFKSHLYRWKGTVVIASGAVTKVQWSDAEAITETAKPARQISDEAVIYNERKSGVVIVEGDRGRGSGFVVDAQGLILTNEHVVEGGRWVAVKFDHGIRVPAVVVEEDKAADVAVICVNPAAFKDFTVLPLADPSQGSLAVEGEKVLAIGSPLNQEKVLTIGIVSKVENDYLVSDVNINHGSSGGPLLNLAGDVIGLTTFIDSAQNGPGISGIVAISKALPVLERAKQKIKAGLRMLSAERLPDVSPVPIPDEALTAYTTKESKPWSSGHPKNFETILATTFYIHALEAEYETFLSKDRENRIKKRGKEGVKDELQVSPSRFWERYAFHSADALVWVIVRPTLQTKSSSMWGSVFGAMAGVNVPTKKEYRDDFYDMALYRGDTLVHPIHRQRDIVTALYADYTSSANDSALGGIYFYDPSVFAPGQELKLYVRRESDLNRWDVVNIDGKEQERIYKMFMPYRAAFTQAGGSVEVVQGLSTLIHTPPMAGAQWSPEAQEASMQLSESVTPVAATSLLPVTKPALSATLISPAKLTAPPSHSSPAIGSNNEAAAITSLSTPASLLIRGIPCLVRVETKDGNSYLGTATKFDGKVYTLQTHQDVIQIRADNLASVDYP